MTTGQTNRQATEKLISRMKYVRKKDNQNIWSRFVGYSKDSDIKTSADKLYKYCTLKLNLTIENTNSNTTEGNNSASLLDLPLSFGTEGQLHTSIYEQGFVKECLKSSVLWSIQCEVPVS